MSDYRGDGNESDSDSCVDGQLCVSGHRRSNQRGRRGRLFEGTAADMHNNMVKLMALPDNTRIYCGHEYTEKNLRFALTLEPNNAQVQAKLRWAQEMRAKQLPTVPSTVAEEKEINPFVRVHSAELQTSVKQQFPTLIPDPVAVLEKTRFLKDNF